mmetsp:Transcript_22317/g.67888  ORF Transcript_22317/g.67888 Transcript_22317/m.67888 type:complete len:119 (-) Transcript_22317:1980-2336(-)|eukprot:scaffold124701_cov28-Tisochrysis_lutea.AAC.4
MAIAYNTTRRKRVEPLGCLPSQEWSRLKSRFMTVLHDVVGGQVTQWAPMPSDSGHCPAGNFAQSSAPRRYLQQPTIRARGCSLVQSMRKLHLLLSDAEPQHCFLLQAFALAPHPGISN